MRVWTLSVACVVVLALPPFCLGQSVSSTLPASAPAGTPIAPPPSIGTDLYFDSAAAVQQALALLPPPPAPGSDAQAANAQTLNTILATATPQMKANAQATANYSVFDFATVLGPGFTADNLPTLNTFITNVTINTVNSASQLKAVYNSPGPQMAATYPSTQTMMGMNEGALLALMVPEKAPQLQTFGVQEGLNRLIMNAHWPTDVAGGQMLSTIYLQDLFASPRFVSDYTAAKAEVRAQQGLK